MLGPSFAGPAPQQSGGGGAAARQEGISDAPFGSHPVPPSPPPRAPIRQHRLPQPHPAPLTAGPTAAAAVYESPQHSPAATLAFEGRGRRGGGDEVGGGGTQKCVYPKWPDQMFPTEFTYCYLFLYHSFIYYSFIDLLSFIYSGIRFQMSFLRTMVNRPFRLGGGGGLLAQGLGGWLR